MITYKEAIQRALSEGMYEHPKSFVLGQDVAQFSILGVTRGLREAFGAERVRDCPIAESAMVGIAAGAAMNGYTGVLEFAYADISAVAFSSIVHSAAKQRYATNGQLKCPLVIRSPIGRWSRHGPMGSEVTASWYCNLPDLAIAMPATAAEAYAQMKAAFSREIPTLYLEDKSLYPEKGELDPSLRAEAANLLAHGSQLTIVAAGRAAHVAVKAAADLDVQVLSLGHVKPFDKKTVLACARRTGRVLVVQDEPPFGGYGPIVMAALHELEPGELKRAPVLLAREDTFLPYLSEENHLPDVRAVRSAARELISH